MPAITSLDLSNAKLDVDHIADIATSLLPTATDRLGHTKDTISGAVYKIASFTDKGIWSASTNYQVKDLVSVTASSVTTWYVCVVQHLSSSSFSIDSQAKWRVYQGVTSGDLASNSGSTLIGYNNKGETRTISSMLDQLMGGWVNASDPRFAGGVRGGEESASALQAAHDYASATFDSSTVFYNQSSLAPKFSGTASLRWDTNRVGLEGCGRWDGTGYTGSVFLTIIQSEPVPGARPGRNALHPIKNIIFDWNGANVNTTLIRIEDPSSLKNIAGVMFKNCSFWNARTIVYMGDGCFFTNFSDCDFGTHNGFNGGTRSHVVMPEAVNSGERNSFINCRFAGAGVYLTQGNGNASTFLIGCSFNYCDGNMVFVSAGEVYITGIHIESNHDSDFWFRILNSNSYLSIMNGKIVVSGHKSNFAIFECQSSVVGGGLSLNNIFVAGASDPSILLVEGTGPTTVDNIGFYAPGTFPHIGPAANLLQYTDFSSVQFTDEWAVSGTTPPALSSEYSFGGSSPFSLKFSGAAGQNNGASTTVRCDPGQVVSTRFWYFATGFLGSGTFFGVLQFLNAAGSPIDGAGTQLINVNANVVAGGLRVIPQMSRKAPRGTRSARIMFSFFGVSSGTPSAYLDVPEINVY